MGVIHHSAICVRDIDASLRFWRDGLGFEVLMDGSFEGDWPTLLRAPSTELRSVFLGDPAHPDAGVVELVDLGPVEAAAPDDAAPAREGFLLLSVMTDVAAARSRLAALGLEVDARQVEVHGVALAVVRAPDGTLVELVDTPAAANLDRLTEAPTPETLSGSARNAPPSGQRTEER
ncbi:MAG: VOC family protein [Actinobacteria bacterium]|nr:VOC family protein [Actinomycetota bacterium]